MVRSDRAPVLSATRRFDSCWITSRSCLPGLLHDLGEAPALRLRKGARLDDSDDIADVRLVPLIVCVNPLREPDDLLVAPVRLRGVDADDDRLVHRVRDDDAAALLAPASLVLGLRKPDDRLARAVGRAGTAGLPDPRAGTAVILRPAHTLRLGRRSGRGRR